MAYNENLVAALTSFIDATSNEQRKAAMEKNWSYLNSEEADRYLLDQLNSNRDDQSERVYFRELRYFLWRCRNEGISHAFEHPKTFAKEIQSKIFDFINAADDGEAHDIYQRYSTDLLSAEAERFLAHLIMLYRDDEPLIKHIEKRKNQIEKCRAGDIPGAFPPHEINVPAYVIEILDELLRAPDRIAEQEIVRRHADVLLTDETVAVLEFLISVDPDPHSSMISRMRYALNMLKRCKVEGLDMVFDQSDLGNETEDTVDESTMNAFIKLLSEMNTDLIDEKDVEKLIADKPAFRNAWKVYKKKQVYVSKDNPGKAALHDLLSQFIEANDQKDWALQVKILREALAIPLVE